MLIWRMSESIVRASTYNATRFGRNMRTSRPSQTGKHDSPAVTFATE